MSAKYITEELSVDVLVVGGGIGGLTAAVSLKETKEDLDILVCEKQTAGYSGKANKGGGVLQYFDSKRVSPDQFVMYHANAVGCYLGNQELMHKYVAMNNEMIDKLIAWGVQIPQREDGSLEVHPTGPMTGMIGVDLDITVRIRRTAEKKGIKFMDKTTVCEFLTDKGKIAGATAYSILDGTFYIIKAKAVVLATGSQNYRIGPMWSSGRGDGFHAAFRAGAEMRNPEFGAMAQLYRVNSYHEVVFGENVMYNGIGDNITKNFRRFPEADISASAVAEWYKQMMAGRGPIYLRPDECEMTKNKRLMLELWNRPYGYPFWKANFDKAETVDIDWEIAPSLQGEQSPVKIDMNMESTLPGLFAIGDASYAGSTIAGAVPAPPGRNRGSGILNAVFGGIICNDKVIERIQEAGDIKLNPAQIEECRERTYAPLNRAEGVHAKDVIRIIQSVICPVEYSIYMSDHRLTIALRKVEKAKNLVSQLKAVDFHDLLACHEAEAICFSAEMLFRAALMRKESRGWFLREDYPKMDNENWLKWIVVKNVDGEMVFDTEKIPFEKWPVQPPMH